MAVSFLDLSARGRIRATGEDRKRLLHAMTTNHVQQLEPGQGLYAFFLNAQGRILADAVLLCEPESVLLCLEPEVREKIFQHLDHFIIADDVTLEDVTAATAEYGVEGEGSGALLAGLGLTPPTARYHFTAGEGTTLVRHSITGGEGFRLIVPAVASEAWKARLLGAGAIEGTPEQWEARRIRHGVPRYGADITESNLLQETRQMHAAHFSKGCYLGQEIVERVRARGHVNRTLVHLLVHSSEAPAPGTKIVSGEREGGEITSSAWIDGEVYALGYLRVELQRDPSVLRVLGSEAELLDN